jgi:hypothetical protein
VHWCFYFESVLGQLAAANVAVFPFSCPSQE